MEKAIHKEIAKVRRDVDRTKAAFSALHRAEKKEAPGGEMIDSTMRILFQLKADTRYLKLYLHELNLANLQVGSDSDRPRALLAASAASYDDMVRFEKKFIYHEHEHSNGADTSVLDMIHELCRIKDSALLKIITVLFGTLGVDQVVKNDVMTRDGPSVTQKQRLELNTYASQGSINLLHLFATFKAMEERLRRLNSMSADKVGLLKDIENLRQMVEQLTIALEAARRQSAEASKELEAALSSHGRHQMLVRTQARVDDLESEKVSLEKENASLTREKFMLTQQISSMTDNFITSKAQLSEAKSAYQRDVAQLMPLVQDRVTQKLETKKVLDSMCTIADMGMGKAQAEVKRNKMLSEDLRQAEERRLVAERELQSTQSLLEKTTIDRNRLQKINLVVTAAKMRFHQEAIALQRMLAATEGERDDLRAKVKEQYDTQALLDSLYQRLDTLSESSERARDLYIIEKTSNEALELQNQQLKAEVESINSGGGMTNLKKQQWDEREEYIEKLKKSEERMKTDLTAYIMKINQLERRNRELDQELAAMQKRIDDYF